MSGDDNRRNPSKGKSFQVKVAAVAAQHFRVEFGLDYAIPIGKPPKLHKFDLVSKNGQYVGECKNYGWTAGRNTPSAKMALVNEAVFYLQQLPGEKIRFVVMRRDVRHDKEETLAQYYERTYRHLLRDVRVFELDETTNMLRHIRKMDSSA